MIRQLVYIFIIAFVLNFVWEQFHSLLYVHYKGGLITEYILFRAALFDATIITILAYPFLKFTVFKDKLWLLALIAVVYAIGLEMWAIGIGQWAYKDSMPIIPIIKTGLTPTIQLGLLAYIAVKSSLYISKNG